MSRKMDVKGNEIRVSVKDTNDYISLTDIARHKEPGRTDHVIQNW